MDLTSEFLKQLQSIVGPHRVLTEASAMQSYAVDRTTLWQANSLAVVFPDSVVQVQQLVKLANQHQIAVVPSGGRTGLSGGAVAANGELVIALDKMNRILNLNTQDQTISCEAGVITHFIQEAAKQQGLFYPVDFASAGSSQMGGNIATNAGGINVIRFGMTRDWVRGLTVVTGAGDILDLNRGLIKNNSGYDFRHLFIGSEGTLGIICEATLALAKPPKNPSVLLLALSDATAIPKICALFKGGLPLLACEFFSDLALKKVMESQNIAAPFNTAAPYYLLIEFEQLDKQTAEKALQLFEVTMDNSWVTDGVLSNSQKQSMQLWQLREIISESLAPLKPYKNDIAVSPSLLPEFMLEVTKLIAEEHADFEVVWFGHAGDGNMHLNIIKPEQVTAIDFTKSCKALSLKIAVKIQHYGGTISAEHGVGLLKKDYLRFTRSDQEIVLMGQLKKVFDPKGIMNPGKLIG